jgi:hypothetical protein
MREAADGCGVEFAGSGFIREDRQGDLGEQPAAVRRFWEAPNF